MARAYVFSDSDGEPWAVIVDGHVTDKTFLACARSIAKRESIKVAGKIERVYMRDMSGDEESDTPWHWCKGTQRGAKAVTVIKQPEYID